ncbi:unnamed protein product, partial [Onchocerca flexuosa]|uniref:MyTH4 domain-containing protein n=1 Tax=Onchocerca flexuosa TaxID=387005 RepID=A0A183I0B3_9BILA
FRSPQRSPQGLSESFYGHYAPHSLWSYSREPIKMPLLKKLQGKREPSQAAVKGYLAILKYMGDYPCRRISTITELTDEVFRGAFKYVRLSFPSFQIKEHGWELMWLCTGIFPPSQSLLNEVESFFRTTQHSLALHCLIRLRRIQRIGRRKFPPHNVEVEAVRQRTVQIFHKVFFPDNSDEIIEVDSMTKARDFCHRIAARLGLKCVDGFALFVKVNSKVISIPDNEFFFDFLRQLFEWVHPKNGTLFNFSYQLFFMKKLWVNVVPGEDRIADFIFHYPQELPKYLRGYHAVTRQQAVDNWNSGNTYFHMTIGSLMKGGRGTRLLLETSLGYKMDDLLTSYIKLFLSNLNRPSVGMIEREATEA